MKKQLEKLFQQLDKARAKNDIIGRCKIQKQIESLKDKMNLEVVEERIDMMTIFSKLSDDKRSEMILNLNSISVLIDWIEILSMKIEADIQKAYPTAKLHQYDAIIELGKAAKKQMTFMFENTSENYQNAIAYNSDALLEKTIKGVKTIIKKMK